ncbi:hypothetical protein [Candidatus Liberibacter solanacearum]|uniref:Uncharacterized protein n=2 Tax=Candidatus Liberibacter solanacearum TaxID=556287 RepID=A0A0F4VLF6_9HYPH|nr:hypothetical protein [Candidatus Liberibacter solanacearum]ADR52212.1 hypothetical protein CKC_02305 [Candidatus Liberibacter solanacearum CLso-ZC1]KJZ82338.1 hypothetical protein DJ66_1088 [Candidatus Liberibacter solanacearum]
MIEKDSFENAIFKALVKSLLEEKIILSKVIRKTRIAMRKRKAV